jgi:adenosine deaminase
MRYVNDHRIPLEVCLSSNVQTRAVRTAREHPFHFYFKQGLRVTLNTDNRLMSDTTVTEELAVDGRKYVHPQPVRAEEDHHQRASRARSCPTTTRRACCEASRSRSTVC